MLNRSFFAGMFAGVIVVFVIGIAALGIAIFLPKQFLSDLAAKNLRPPALPMAQADYAWPLNALDDASFDLTSVKGKALVITIWQPDCNMCLAELPLLQALQAKCDPESTRFLLVAPIPSAKASDPGPFIEEMKQVAEETQVTIPMYTCSSPLPDAFAVASTPATMIVAPDGQIVAKHVGAAKWDDDSCVQFINALTIMKPGE